MHKEGWKLVSIKGNKYEFEKCIKENWVYQLDFKEDGIVSDDYIQMFSDYGWEFVFRFRKWFYFRKKSTEVQKTDLSIFSDNESKIAMFKRLIKSHFYKAIPISIIFLIYDYLLFQTSFFKVSGSVILSIMSILLFGVMLVGIGIYVGQISRLYKFISKIENKIK